MSTSTSPDIATWSLRTQWLSNVRVDLLSGLVVALALIPEAISFSVIAGVDPAVGLYASVIIAIVVSIAGGRPAMISAATGAMALVIANLVADHGIDYLFAVAVLAGLFQLLWSALGVGALMRFIPQPVMTGFVNALAILIFLAQLDHIIGKDTMVLVLVLIGIAIIVVVPKLTTAIPAPLVAIALVGVGAAAFGVNVPNVGDMGELPTSLPSFHLPDIPMTWETAKILVPYALTLSVVGLLESLLTATLIDEITDTRSNKNREAFGQGLGNIAAGFFGGMPGCAMIGQSMVNVDSGGRTRLSTFVSGAFLLAGLLAASGIVAEIPMAALVAVMIVVCIKTFDWNSIRPSQLKAHPKTETAVMVAVVAAVLATDNLAIGVGVGVLLSALFFARRVANMAVVTSTIDDEANTRVYVIQGQLFFASTNDLKHRFDFNEPLENVIIDLGAAHIWDTSAVGSLNAIVDKFASRGVNAAIVGMNEHSEDLHRNVTAVRPNAASH